MRPRLVRPVASSDTICTPTLSGFPLEPMAPCVAVSVMLSHVRYYYSIALCFFINQVHDFAHFNTTGFRMNGIFNNFIHFHFIQDFKACYPVFMIVFIQFRQ